MMQHVTSTLQYIPRYTASRPSRQLSSYPFIFFYIIREEDESNADVLHLRIKVLK